MGHILKESRVGAVLYETLIPKNKDASLRSALFDGEDFELLFTLPAHGAEKFLKTKTKPFPFYYIGDIVKKKEGFTLIGQNGSRTKIPRKGFSHF